MNLESQYLQGAKDIQSFKQIIESQTDQINSLNAQIVSLKASQQQLT